MGCSRESITQVGLGCGREKSLPRRTRGRATSFEEHAVSVGVETVALAYCVFIGCQDVLSSAEGAYQHQQGGLRQGEIGQHRFDCLEFETSFGIWVDEEVGSGWACGDCSSADTNCVF